ncbi:MAG: ATP/GTP-binding protein [Thermococcus sp.]|nr:ATP/GTP-binding protein [Thermococcus sp.]
MISHLKIENFRGIKSLELENLGQVNVIVGKNNSSKSSVLEALALLLGACNGNQSFKETLQGILIWRGWYGEQAIEDLFHKESRVLKVGAIKDNNESLTLALNNIHKVILDAKLIKENESLLNAQLDNFRLIDDRVFSSFMLSSKFTPDARFEFLTPLALRRFGYVESLYSYAYEQKVVKKSVEILSVAYPEIEGFSPLFKVNRWVLHVETKYGVYPYYLMGEGFKNAMIIAFLSALLKDGYLLIDSAEAFHHPKSLRIMAQTLIKGAKENNVQVFLTTHSLELIDMLLEEGIKARIDGRVIYMKRKNGKLTHSIETFENAKELREDLGIDLRG